MAALWGGAPFQSGSRIGMPFATQLLEAGYDNRTVQTLVGHRGVNTVMIYTHVLNRGRRG